MTVANFAKPTKHDSDKPQFHYIPYSFLVFCARAFMYGAEKYAAYNWRQGEGLEPVRLWDALQRHLWQYKDVERDDPESGLHHLSHATTCLAMLIGTLEMRGCLTNNGPMLLEMSSKPVEKEKTWQQLHLNFSEKPLQIDPFEMPSEEQRTADFLEANPPWKDSLTNTPPNVSY